MSDLYEDDVVLWSEQQARLLRRRAAGELVNETEVDWPNIAEAIESVGNEQRFAVESLLVQGLCHWLKPGRNAGTPPPGALTPAAFWATRRRGSCHRCGRGSIWRGSGGVSFARCQKRLTAWRRPFHPRNAHFLWTNC